MKWIKYKKSVFCVSCPKKVQIFLKFKNDYYLSSLLHKHIQQLLRILIKNSWSVNIFRYSKYGQNMFVSGLVLK